MSDPETLAVYAAQAEKYATLATLDMERPHVERFIAQMPKGARVLDIGCGPGVVTGAFAAAGMEAEAWDPVSEMVAMAAAQPGVTARQAVYADLVAEGVYDGIWANFSMLHTSLADWPAQFAAVARALKPGGLFHFGTKLGEGEARDSIGRLYSYISEPALMELMAQTGLTVEYTRTGEGAGLSGEVAPFISVQARA
ncbi:bifunctional 2-polyprenyl-6-hydroxyphenol methylase/3-demethylubiquinol 3-O-methyltransferase UbiG [uncultured Tateyamaria sp.]|uniref:class I SAM-dependent methyltransferase n=1 Tax=uncultured Tateyamaria sp. TaxID=455651 RepID=UPI0026373B50|nr:class I SAM-dependent methyltransferase [uncultured Tateyamaria sp.]